MEAVHKPKKKTKKTKHTDKVTQNECEQSQMVFEGVEQNEVSYSAVSKQADIEEVELIEKDNLLCSDDASTSYDTLPNDEVLTNVVCVGLENVSLEEKEVGLIVNPKNVRCSNSSETGITIHEDFFKIDNTEDTEITTLCKTKITPEAVPNILLKPRESNEECDDEFDELSKLMMITIETLPLTDNQLLSIYRNEELESLNSLVDQFLDEELRGGHILRHPLYDMLTKYLRAREKQTINMIEIESLLNDCEDIQRRLWILETDSLTESGECQDGNPVEATHEFQVGRFDHQLFGTLGKNLASIREMTNEKQTLFTYTAQAYKLKIDHFIYETTLKFSNLPHNSPVCLISHLPQNTLELKYAISVLFYFQRRPCKDAGFISDTRLWLTKLVAMLLRVATWTDHMFILNHVLRCPAGINKWAVNFIQPPPAPYNSNCPSHYLNHILATLAVIVSPIKEREAFITVADKNETDDLWVVIDSDGEDEDLNIQKNLRENDIVSLLNQIPFDYLFRQILLFNRRDDIDIYMGLSSSEVLRVFAITRVLLRILENGLRYYEAGRHQQFTKRLASLVLHSAQYTTDIWEAFKRDNNECHDSSLLDRLQVEYDHILYSTSQCLLSTSHKSTTQFLAVLPYSAVSLQTLWKIFHMILQPNFNTEGMCSNTMQWWAGLEELINSLSDAELYYILTTVANMAIARNVEDWLFIKMVSSHLLQIGFLNLSTKELCYKTVRTLLGNLTNKYPSLISVILKKLKRSVTQAGNLIIYLFKELPLDFWVPTSDDFDLLENWLIVCPFGSIEGALARYILSNLQWGVNPNSEGDLFLGREIHYRTALLVAKLAILHCAESPSSSNTVAISETIKLLTNTISRGGSNEQSLSLWVWQMLFKLRLHLLDQPDSSIWETLNNPSLHLSILPSLDSPPDEMSFLVNSLKDKQVTAIYVALSITSEGHSIPLICNCGFDRMTILIQCHRYFPVLVLLHHIIPLFADCPGSLTTSEKFQGIIMSLVLADKTFLKQAKNMITSEFPGIIIKQFGGMIQSHLENYRRYSLSSPEPLAQLWLSVLAKCWTLEPANITYLMDIILRVSYFHPELKKKSFSILGDLLQQTIESTQNESYNPPKTKFSLASWVSSNSSFMTLMPRPVPDTPWFALFALELDHFHNFTKNGLWRQLLIELYSTSSKPNIDAVLKKCCNALKINSISSNNLLIYRWAQQALETPVDHPALPLIWQKFFTLYLTRVPGDKDLGCVGSKFFEGITNFSFLKKLKKKIKDCREYFDGQRACTTQALSSDKKDWLDKVARLYTSYGLWLEEPRLQESRIYLPALPPQYDGAKLKNIFEGNEEPWYEYLDYEAVLKQQKENVHKWEGFLSRKLDYSSQRFASHVESDPVANIVKRFQSYDCPIAAPPLRSPQQVIPSLTRDVIFSSSLMIETLKDSFMAILNYAETFILHSAECVGLNFAFLEMLPKLYQLVESEVKLYAACDTTHNGQRVSPEALTCAGPAVIRIKVCEVRVSEAIDLAIHNFRVEMKSALKQALQPPPLHVVIGSVFIEYVVRILEKEWHDLQHVGDVQLLKLLQEVGVALFYYVASIFTVETSIYPPMKQLITTCMETLGQCFISGDEKQANMLLSTLLETPSLSSLLATHFSPMNTSPPVYIQLYKSLTDTPQTVSQDLIFVLLSKFEIAQWLETKKPRLSECSQLIDLVGKALAKAGQNPPNETLMIHEILRRHLCILMTANAPQHYCEVVSVALNHTESHSLSTDVWFDIINALTFHTDAKFRPHMSLAQVVTETAKYATQQKILSHHELNEMSALVTYHFNKERLQYGLYGLYPKYRMYVSPFTSLLGILGQALVITSLTKHETVYPKKVCEELWPLISGLYSPWLSPYLTQSLAQPTAAWIQQLTDDRSILLPWIAGDAGHAHKMVAMFTETIRFVIETVQGCEDIFSYLWQYYVTNYAHTSVKEHVLSVIHSNLLSLPWPKFSPSIYDLDLMLKVSDTYVPYCHTLLGSIFIDINWLAWIQKIPDDFNVSSRVHNALLHLLIKLANEPNVRQSGKVVKLLEDSKTFHWEVVDCTSYESVMNWFVMSYDPRVVLKLEGDMINVIDSTALDLLKVASGFLVGVSDYHVSTSRKRQVYVRAYTKLLTSSLSKYKTLITSHPNKVEAAIEDILTQIDYVISNTGNNYSEAGLLIGEVLSIMNLPEGNSLPKLTTNSILKWLSGRGYCVLVAALLRTLGTTVSNHYILGTIMEAALTAIFNDRNGGDWNLVKSLLQEVVPRHPPLEESLVANSHLLSLYANTIKKIPQPDDLREESIILNDVLQWISAVKLNENIEPKLVLLAYFALCMCSHQCENPSVTHNLQKLVEIANSWAEYKPSWDILGAIGLRKQITVSNRFRVACKALVVIILNQLPERKGELPTDQLQFIRTHPHSPGGITCNNMELGPSAETVKILSQLESMVSDKNWADVKHAAELGVRLVKQPENAMHNAHDVFLEVITQLYSERYILVLKES